MKPHLEEASRMLEMSARDLTALEVLASSPEVHFSILCFHAQQVVEKCFKAVLYCYEVEFRRTHDLELLAHLTQSIDVVGPLSEDDLALLGPCAVRLRYDDAEMDVELLTSDDLQRTAVTANRWASQILDSFRGKNSIQSSQEKL